MTKPPQKLIDYKNVRVSLVTTIVCWAISSTLSFIPVAVAIKSSNGNFTLDSFKPNDSLQWIDRLSQTFNILFIIVLFYLLIQIVQYYQTRNPS